MRRYCIHFQMDLVELLTVLPICGKALFLRKIADGRVRGYLIHFQMDLLELLAVLRSVVKPCFSIKSLPDDLVRGYLNHFEMCLLELFCSVLPIYGKALFAWNRYKAWAAVCRYRIQFQELNKTAWPYFKPWHFQRCFPTIAAFAGRTRTAEKSVERS